MITAPLPSPLPLLVDWAMSTPAGHSAFLMPQVNAALGEILNEWGRFLRSPDSTYTLTEDPTTGWLGATALALMFPGEW